MFSLLIYLFLSFLFIILLTFCPFLLSIHLFFFFSFLLFHYSIYYGDKVDGGNDKQEKQGKGEKEGEEKSVKEGEKEEKEGEKAMQNSRAAVADQLCTSQISSASRLSECLQSKLKALKLIN
jgi:hypothetical protein